MGEILSVVKGDEVDIDRLMMDLCEWEFTVKPFPLPYLQRWVPLALASESFPEHLDGDWATVEPMPVAGELPPGE